MTNCSIHLTDPGVAVQPVAGIRSHLAAFRVGGRISPRRRRQLHRPREAAKWVDELTALTSNAIELNDFYEAEPDRLIGDAPIACRLLRF